MSKVKTIKTKRFRAVFRIILWLIVIFIATRGVFSMLRKDQTSSLKALIAANINEQDTKIKTGLGANSFAENFTRAFIEFNGDTKTYMDNLLKYVSSQFKASSNTSRTAVLSVTAVKTDWINKNKVLVDCLVRFTTDSNQTIVNKTPVETKSPRNNQSATSTPKDKIQSNVKEMCLRVPISIKDDGKYIIESSPTFVANDSRSSQQDKTQMDGVRIKNEDIQEITEAFLKSYCEDNSTSIRYYMADNSKIKGLDGDFTFKEIDTFELKKNGDKYNADVTYYVEGNAGSYIQGIQIVFVYKNNRYLIEKLNTIINMGE